MCVKIDRAGETRARARLAYLGELPPPPAPAAPLAGAAPAGADADADGGGGGAAAAARELVAAVGSAAQSLVRFPLPAAFARCGAKATGGLQITEIIVIYVCTWNMDYFGIPRW